VGAEASALRLIVGLAHITPCTSKTRFGPVRSSVPA